MIPQELQEVHRNFWNMHHAEYDMTTNEGCGKYTEAFVRYAQNNGFSKVGHLKKNPGQTQYNGHANDAFLYAEPFSENNPLYQAVDIIGAAESTDPNNPPRPNWGIDIPRYTQADWLKEPGTTPVSSPSFPGYEDLGGDTTARELLGKVLAADYKEANQPMNDGSVVWTFRTLYDAFYDIIVNKMNSKEAINKSINKHRSEWRKELGLK